VSPARLSAFLLSIATAAAFVAWSIQSSAASAMQTTLRLQTAEVPDPDAAPPSLDENRRILAVLSDSIEIRKTIDALLSDVERAVSSLSARQETALSLAARGRHALEQIGRSLDGAASATRTSVARLSALDRRLEDSLSLAVRIARELAELDAKLGPGREGAR
jgi:hypothetical protein